MRSIRPLLVPVLLHSSGIRDPAAEYHHALHFPSGHSSFVHLFLILTLRRAIQSILDDLEKLDIKLGRPKFSSIHRWSAIATL